MLKHYYRSSRLRLHKLSAYTKRAFYTVVWNISTWAAKKSADFFRRNGLRLPGAIAEDRYDTGFENRY